MSMEQGLEMAQEITFCTLCGATPSHVGAFLVGEGFEEKYSGLKANPDKRRLIYYGLCRHCFGLDDKADRVERRLASLFSVERN